MNDNEVYFSVGEQEIIAGLQEVYEITYLEACENVIIQKRQAAFAWQRRGNFALARQILEELGEWSEAFEEEFNRQEHYGSTKKIILPGDENKSESKLLDDPPDTGIILKS